MYTFNHSETSLELNNNCISAIRSRAVTFSTWKVVCVSRSIETLLNASFPTDNYSIDVVAYGKQLSTRQKRQIMTQLNITKPTRVVRAQATATVTPNNVKKVHHQFRVLLHYAHHDPGEEVDRSIDAESMELIEARLCMEVIDDDIVGTTTASASTSLVVDHANTDIDVDTDNDNDSKSKVSTVGRTSATPLKPVMSQLLSNLAKVEKGSLILDLCCGSGSLFAPNAANAGSVGIGCDVQLDDNFVRNPASNFVLANIHHDQIHGLFDAVIVDPPYGRRETHVDALGCHVASHESNEQRALERFKILTPLFITANRVLRPGGRLVFLFFNYPNSDTCAWDSTDLPIAQSATNEFPRMRLKLLHTCREQWAFQSGHSLARDVCVLEKF